MPWIGPAPACIGVLKKGQGGYNPASPSARPRVGPTTMPSLALARVVLCVRDIPAVAAFYQQHFGLQPMGDGEPGWLELAPRDGGCAIALPRSFGAELWGSNRSYSFRTTA